MTTMVAIGCVLFVIISSALATKCIDMFLIGTHLLWFCDCMLKVLFFFVILDLVHQLILGWKEWIQLILFIHQPLFSQKLFRWLIIWAWAGSTNILLHDSHLRDDSDMTHDFCMLIELSFYEKVTMCLFFSDQSVEAYLAVLILVLSWSVTSSLIT